MALTPTMGAPWHHKTEHLWKSVYLYCISSYWYIMKVAYVRKCGFNCWSLSSWLSKIDVIVILALMSLYSPQCNARIIPHNAYFISIPSLNTLTMVVYCVSASVFTLLSPSCLFLFSTRQQPIFPLAFSLQQYKPVNIGRRILSCPKLPQYQYLRTITGTSVNEQRSAKKN